MDVCVLSQRRVTAELYQLKSLPPSLAGVVLDQPATFRLIEFPIPKKRGGPAPNCWRVKKEFVRREKRETHHREEEEECACYPSVLWLPTHECGEIIWYYTSDAGFIQSEQPGNIRFIHDDDWGFSFSGGREI